MIFGLAAWRLDPRLSEEGTDQMTGRRAGRGGGGDDESHILLTNNSAAQFVKNGRKKVVVDEECWATLELLKTSRRFGVR